jgi:catechol 2,3-dioxygenase-like lactoylglutathione lyase family enzyme
VRRGPLPYVGVRPTTNSILPVVDMTEATAFYRSLGFEVDAYDEGYAWVTHCGWEWLHLRRVDSVDGNRASAYLHVADADEWHAAMRAATAGEIALADPVDTPWGKREFSFDDPAGNHIRIGSDARRDN